MLQFSQEIDSYASVCLLFTHMFIRNLYVIQRYTHEKKLRKDFLLLLGTIDKQSLYNVSSLLLSYIT